jgi:lysozyme family protein
MANNFDRALKVVLKYEGGFVNHPSDPGGMTNLGITHKTYSNWIGRDATEDEMRNLKLADVKPIYSKFWNKLNCDQLPSGLDLVVFDFAVNAGIKRSARLLQNLIGADEDGEIGEKTIRLAAHYALNKPAISDFSNKRRAYYATLSHFSTFGKGWIRRTNEVSAIALSWA